MGGAVGRVFGEWREEQSAEEEEEEAEKVAPGVGAGPGNRSRAGQAGRSAVLGLGEGGQEGPRGLMAWKTREGLRDCQWSRGRAEIWLGAGK